MKTTEDVFIKKNFVPVNVFLSPFLKFSKILILNRGTIYPKKTWKNLQKDMQTLKLGIFWGTQNKIFFIFEREGIYGKYVMCWVK